MYKTAMFFILFSLFIILPIVEVSLIFRVSSEIGGWNTIGIVILTGFVGAFFARQEGQRVFSSLKKDLEVGVLPANSLIDGLLVFVGGFLLITPGFLTDFLGLSFIFAPTRKLFVGSVKRGLEKAVRSGKVKVNTYSNVNGFEQSYSSDPMEPPEKEVREAKVIDIRQKKEGEELDQ